MPNSKPSTAAEIANDAIAKALQAVREGSEIVENAHATMPPRPKYSAIAKPAKQSGLLEKALEYERTGRPVAAHMAVVNWLKFHDAVPTEPVTKTVTKSGIGRPSTGKAMTGAERMRRLRAKQRDEDDIEPECTLDGRKISSGYAAFVMRADAACTLAGYPIDAEIDDDILRIAKGTANKWATLHKQLKQRRIRHGA